MAYQPKIPFPLFPWIIEFAFFCLDDLNPSCLLHIKLFISTNLLARFNQFLLGLCIIRGCIVDDVQLKQFDCMPWILFSPLCCIYVYSMSIQDRMDIRILCALYFASFFHIQLFPITRELSKIHIPRESIHRKHRPSSYLLIYILLLPNPPLGFWLLLICGWSFYHTYIGKTVFNRFNCEIYISDDW